MGRPLVLYALEALRAARALDEIVVVVAPQDVERARRSLLEPQSSLTERIVAGGDTRQASVRAGLAEISPSCDLVLIHDAARPCLRAELVRACLQAADRHGAAVAALPATDTVKEAGPDGLVTTTLDRSHLWLVQTPQAFRRDLLLHAHEAAARDGLAATDDASLVERLGHPVQLVLGHPDNIKITHQEDVPRSEHILSQGRHDVCRGFAFRSGIGYDAHAFVEDRPLVLAGIRLRSNRGLLGHSDADVVCHAVCDALLGAIGAGDIGRHFPDSDPQYAGISSLSLLAQTSHLVREAGWHVENVDATVILEGPRIAPHIPDMRRALADAIGTPPDRVNLKAKTTEGMGFTGRREGIAAQAIALVRSALPASEQSDPEEQKCRSTSQRRA